jgi:hypothetical protein
MDEWIGSADVVCFQDARHRAQIFATGFLGQPWSYMSAGATFSTLVALGVLHMLYVPFSAHLGFRDSETRAGK